MLINNKLIYLVIHTMTTLINAPGTKKKTQHNAEPFYLPEGNYSSNSMTVPSA